MCTEKESWGGGTYALFLLTLSKPLHCAPRAVSGNQSVIAPLASILEEGWTAGNTSLFNVKCNRNLSALDRWIEGKKIDTRFLNSALPQTVKWKLRVQYVGLREIGFSVVSLRGFFTER